MELRLPRQIVFSVGGFSRVGELAASLGRRPLVVSGQGALQRSGRLSRALDAMRCAGLRPVEFAGVEHDPSLETCDRGVASARRERCDCVVGIGGGSALDAAKTIALVTPQSASVVECFRDAARVAQPGLPSLAVPTTAGTGTEATQNAVLTDRGADVKKSLRHPTMLPAVALVDPELTLTLPPDVTAWTGMDALTQAIECFVSRAANPFSDALALQAIGLIARRLPEAVADGGRIENREPVAMGSHLAGIAFGNASLGAVHGFAHPIGHHFNVPHGLVCAVLLPVVCEFNLPAERDKFARIAPLLGAQQAEDVPEALADLNRRIGIPKTLASFGLAEAALSAKVLPECRSRSMQSNPRPVAEEDALAILRRLI